MNLKNCSTAAGIVIAAILLAGCHTPPTQIYQWTDYQPVVYKHFNGASPEEEITILEADEEKIKATNSLTPPGFHAHLGMLYASVGKTEQGETELLTEKKLFPESATYIDFLLNKNKKQEH